MLLVIRVGVDIRLGGHHIRGLTNPDVNRKGMYQLFPFLYYITSSSFIFCSKSSQSESVLLKNSFFKVLK